METDEERLMPTKEFADRIGVCVRTLDRMRDKGVVPRYIKQGKGNYLYLSDLMEYFNRLKLQRS